ncbi:MAG: hypothetical protein ACLRXK_02420 [Acutalibacteraceae bacterium]
MQSHNVQAFGMPVRQQPVGCPDVDRLSSQRDSKQAEKTDYTKILHEVGGESRDIINIKNNFKNVAITGRVSYQVLQCIQTTEVARCCNKYDGELQRCFLQKLFDDSDEDLC